MRYHCLPNTGWVWCTQKLSDTNAPLYKDHLSIVTTVGCSMGHLSVTNTPLYKDHLSIVTTVGCSMGHLSDTNTPLYKDHLSIETTITTMGVDVVHSETATTAQKCVQRTDATTAWWETAYGQTTPNSTLLLKVRNP